MVFRDAVCVPKGIQAMAYIYVFSVQGGSSDGGKIHICEKESVCVSFCSQE